MSSRVRIGVQGIQSLAGLEHLYMSTNRITDLSPLGSCRQLRTLALHRNALEDLDSCMATLSALPQLNDLDLSGNPVWFQPECKHRCVAELRALRRYDDEEVTELDRELAAESTAGATILRLQLTTRARKWFHGAASLSQVVRIPPRLLTDRRRRLQRAGVSPCLSEYQLRSLLHQRYVASGIGSVLQMHDGLSDGRMLALRGLYILNVRCFAGPVTSSSWTRFSVSAGGRQRWSVTIYSCLVEPFVCAAHAVMSKFDIDCQFLLRTQST